MPAFRALILQPIVENAIKHAVSPTRDKVELKIAAREAGPGRFTIEVSNSGGGRPAQAQERQRRRKHRRRHRQRVPAPRRRGSARSPIANMARPPDGGYRVLLTLPLDRGDG